MQATVQFIHHENAAFPQHIENRRDERVQSLSSLRFILKLEPRTPVWCLVVKHRHQEFIFFHAGMGNTTRLDQQLITETFSGDGLDVIDTDVRSGQEIANLRPPLRRCKHRRSEIVIHHGVCGKKQDTVRKPPKNRAEKLTVQLCCC